MHIASVEVLTNTNGTPHKHIGILSDLGLNSGEMVSQYWTEGVGGSRGLLSTNGTSFTPLGATGLVCMQYNDTLWPDGLPGQCWQTGIRGVEPTLVGSWFHPSVTSDLLYLHDGLRVRNADIFSMDGRLVSIPLVVGNTISVAALDPGIWIIQAMDEHGLVRRGKFLKE